MPIDQEQQRALQASSFGAAADTYERARPSYPEAAIDWLLPEHGRAVLDLGAGTGKLTRQLVARGLEVTAVEPSAGMLDELRQAVPEATAIAGSAESIPLAPDSVDAVLVAQAWHWVDVPAASLEVARVLRPGGRLGLIWNTRDERVDWVAELGEIISLGVSHMDTSNPLIGKPFGQIEYFVAEWSQPFTHEGLLDLVASRSYMIVAPEQERDRVLRQVKDLLDTHPALAGRGEFELPYVTYASRAHIP